MPKRVFALLAVLALNVTYLVSTSAAQETIAATPTSIAIGSPKGIDVAADGTVYVVDSSSHRVQRITFTNGVANTPTTIAGQTGSSGSGANQLNNPADVAVGPDGSIYIADTTNQRVQKVTFTNGIANTPTTIAGHTGVVGSGADYLRNPSGVAVDDEGTVYITDSTNFRIQRVTFTNGAPNTPTTIAGVTSSGGSGANQLFSPYGVAVDGQGSVYIADRNNHRIQKITFTGGIPNPAITIAGQTGTTGSAPDQLHAPTGVAVDADGSLYIADSYNQRIQKITFTNGIANPATTVAGQTGTAGSGANQLSYPYSLAIDSRGSMYITDRVNHRIQRYTFDTAAPTIDAPTGAAAFTGDSLSLVYNCDDVIHLASCTALLNGTTFASGAELDTTSPGTQTIHITATDHAGNTSTQPVTITITAKPVPVNRHLLTGSYSQATGSEASVARLYMAAYTRQPDSEGFAYWEERHADGMTLQAIADYFVTSPEYSRLYGNTTNSEFVEIMYNNVLDRSPEAEGNAFWISQLNHGMTPARMLLMFSDTPDFRNLTNTN